MIKKSKNESLRRFDELKARQFAVASLSPQFQIIEEVCLSGFNGESFRIDAIAVCKLRGYRVGLEFKSSHLFPAEFADVLRQAINYRDAFIQDSRLPEFDGMRLDCCIVFPDWDGLHDDGSLFYARDAQGMRLLAGHFRVGAMDVNYKNNSIRLTIGQSGVWHSSSGWSANAEGVLRGKRRKGSMKKPA